MTTNLYQRAKQAVLDLCAIAGGITGVISAYAVFSPETVGKYLEEVSASMTKVEAGVDVIAQSIPLWPLINQFEVEFAPPSLATISFSLSNPKNLLVEDFRTRATIRLESGSKEIPIVAPSVIPPNDSISASANIIREDWFMEALKAKDATLDVCFSGKLENIMGRSETENRIFMERRIYTVSLESGSTLLVAREFSSNIGEACT